MNLFAKYISRAVATLSLCAVVSSCSQDDLGMGRVKTPFPGEYPLMFTTTVDEMRSRANEQSHWVDGDTIAVRIGEIGVFDRIGKYRLNADGTVMDEVLPLNWPKPDAIVKAWYPYVDMNEVRTVSIADQSKGYHHADFMRAVTEEEENYKHTINLTFKHLMAKVSTELVRGDGISEEEFATARLYYMGYTGANFSETDLNTDGFVTGLITPDSVNSALLVPRAMNNQPLIIVTLTVNVNGHLIDKTMTYTASSADDLKPGYHNHYTVTVQKDRLQVNPPVSASWTDVVVGDDLNSKPWIFNVVFNDRLSIPKASRKDIVFSENVLNVEDFRDSTVNYLEVEGNVFSLTCNKSQGITPKMHLWPGKT
ncbi:MAG: fimbrillin family protein, partial [Duncaniella sp.]|nr:fimbrillin family protein [Duncaniella sp.]